MYLIIHSATGYFKARNGEKYFFIDSTEKYEEVFSGLRSEIKTLLWKKNYAIIGVNTDDDFTFEKTTNISNAHNNYQMRFSRERKILSTNLFRRVFIWVIKMLQHDRIDVSEGIDINKTSE